MHLSKKNEAVIWAALFALLSAGFFYCLTTTLDELTLRDCNAGVQSACNYLKQ